MLHLDSDVLLYSEVEQAGKRFDDSAMSLAPWGECDWIGHTCFINSPDILNEFVDFIFYLYEDKEGMKLRDKVFAEKTYKSFSDMTCLGLFRQRISYPIADMSQVIDNAVFDNLITSTHGIYERGSRYFKKDWKKIYFRDGIPYCRLKETGDSVRFHSLHFHGGTKYMIKHFAKEHIGTSALLAMIRERTVRQIRKYLHL